MAACATESNAIAPEKSFKRYGKSAKKPKIRVRKRKGTECMHQKWDSVEMRVPNFQKFFWCGAAVAFKNAGAVRCGAG